jgi:hypothetical protein
MRRFNCDCCGCGYVYLIERREVEKKLKANMEDGVREQASDTNAWETTTLAASLQKLPERKVSVNKRYGRLPIHTCRERLARRECSAPGRSLHPKAARLRALTRSRNAESDPPRRTACGWDHFFALGEVFVGQLIGEVLWDIVEAYRIGRLGRRRIGSYQCCGNAAGRNHTRTQAHNF